MDNNGIVVRSGRFGAGATHLTSSTGHQNATLTAGWDPSPSTNAMGTVKWRLEKVAHDNNFKAIYDVTGRQPGKPYILGIHAVN
jgi:hypothetical protein